VVDLCVIQLSAITVVVKTEISKYTFLWLWRMWFSFWFSPVCIGRYSWHVLQRRHKPCCDAAWHFLANFIVCPWF